MYLFTVYDASESRPKVDYLMKVRHKAEATGVTRFQKLRIKHEKYVLMVNG